jgi:hypothetical protein
MGTGRTGSGFPPRFSPSAVPSASPRGHSLVPFGCVPPLFASIPVKTLVPSAQAGDSCSLAPKLLVTDRPSFGTDHGTDPTSKIPNVYAVWYGCTDPGG